MGHNKSGVGYVRWWNRAGQGRREPYKELSRMHLEFTKGSGVRDAPGKKKSSSHSYSREKNYIVLNSFQAKSF